MMGVATNTDDVHQVLLTGDSDGQVTANKRGTVATGRNHVQEIVKGIIEGETRSIVSNMTMEELFNNRRLFKSQVIECESMHIKMPALLLIRCSCRCPEGVGSIRPTHLQCQR